jgi:hypothetical protein
VSVKCTLKLTVGSSVRAARIAVSRRGKVVARGTGFAKRRVVVIRLPAGVSGGSIRVVTIDRSGRLHATNRRLASSS